MIEKTMTRITQKLQQSGYLTEVNARPMSIQSLLYAHTPAPVKMGFAKVDEHLLFIDWEYAAFSKIQNLLEIYKQFSKFVNQGYKTPHSLRMRIPNLALVALSTREYPEEAIEYVKNNYQIPLAGGETGQMMLIDLENNLFHMHYPPHYKQTGSIPLLHAVRVVQECYQGQ